MATLSAVNTYESSQTILLQADPTKRNILILRSPKTQITDPTIQQAVNFNILQQSVNLENCKRNILVLRNSAKQDLESWSSEPSNQNVLLQSPNLETNKRNIILRTKQCPEPWNSVSETSPQEHIFQFSPNQDNKINITRSIKQCDQIAWGLKDSSIPQEVLQQSTTLDTKVNILRNPKQPETILLTNPARKKAKLSAGKEMTRIQNPPPVAVARRNARERNRVKQVNNGFATLRQHIPTAIASTYESGNGRGSNKKLSKVETLRMAVEYIRSLEKLLEISTETEEEETESSSQIMYYEAEDDILSRLQSKKKSNYFYEDEENIHPSMDDIEGDLLGDSNLVNSNLQLTDSTFNSIDNHGSLSPEVYSEHSLSPAHLDPNDTKSFIPVFNLPNQSLLPAFAHLTYERLPQVKAELLSPNATNLEEQRDLIVNAEIINNQSSIIEAIWWGQQPRS